jgi:integrase/recombinase XerD
MALPLPKQSRTPISPTPQDSNRILTRPEFQRLAEVPPEVEWFANIKNENTRKAYRADLSAFMKFTGIAAPEEFRVITRSHVIAWRKNLERQDLSPASIRRKLSAVSDLFEYLCESNAVTHNPVKGVARPKDGANEGKTPALSDAQAKALGDAPPEGTLKGETRQGDSFSPSLPCPPAGGALLASCEGFFASARC